MMPTNGKLSGYIQLTRWKNLIIICVTLYLFNYCILENSSLEHCFSIISLPWHILLIISITIILIAAGGYVINDYYDAGIDLLNKRNKAIVTVLISKRETLLYYGFLSFLATIGAILCGILLHSYVYTISLFLIMAILFLYSTTLKKTFLLGNIVVALLSALPIGFLIIALLLYQPSQTFIINREFISSASVVIRFGVFYLLFAFMISLIREIIKDAEDINGDRNFNCRTLPITIGLKKTQHLIQALIYISSACLIFMTYICIQREHYPLASYLALVPLPLLIYLSIKNRSTHGRPQEFHHLSVLCKVIMLSGIISMLFI